MEHLKTNYQVTNLINMDPINPTQEQLAARLNPTPTTFQTPTGGLFYRDGTLYNLSGNTLNRFELSNLIPMSERASIGNYGAQIGVATQRLRDQYGLDINTLPTMDTSGFSRLSGISGFRQVDLTDPTSFLGQSSGTSTSTTVNQPQPAGTPGNTVVPQSQNTPNNGTPVVQPSTAGVGATTPPGGASQVSGATTANVPAQTYTIQAGDTLSKLAQTYGTTVGALMSLNPQITDANKIYTGQKLNLTAPQTGAPVTGGLKGTDQAPDAMVQQAQMIQDEINRLKSPANTGIPTPPETQTGKTETTNIMDTFAKVSTALGLGDLKSQYNKTLDESKAMQDKKNDEAADINNNPWYSEGKRQMELKKLDKKYELKLNTLSNYAKLYDSMYQEGLANARYLTTGIQQEQQFAMELAMKKQEALDALKASSADFKEVQGGLYNIITGEWVVEPTTTTKPPEAPTVKTINGQDMQWNSSTGKWDAITGTTAPGTVDSTQKSIDQLTFLRSTAQQAMNLSGASGASGISKIVGDTLVGDTKFRQLEALTNTLKTNILTLATDPSIKKFFGPQMSNADVLLMTSAGTTLNPAANSPAQMKSEIQRLDNLFNRMLTAVKTGTTGSGNVITAPDGTQVIITD
jgi:LysM repeat protein